MPTISGFPRPISTAIVPGAPAGSHDVPGALAAGDTLLAVTRVTDADPPVASDLTAEFSIPASTAKTIDNAAGTDTSGDFLVVTWAKGE